MSICLLTVLIWQLSAARCSKDDNIIWKEENEKIIIKYDVYFSNEREQKLGSSKTLGRSTNEGEAETGKGEGE